MKNNTIIRLFVIMVFVLPTIAFAIVTWYGDRLEPLPVFGPVSKKNGRQTVHMISDFSLKDQDGITVSTASWKNRIIVADFFFTHCPVVCPKLTKSFQKVQTAFAHDNTLFFNSFSIDPGRDSVTVLKRYTKRFALDTHNWRLLTGDKKEIYRLARNSFMVVAPDGDGGPEDFIHSEKLVLIDTQKRIRGYYTGTSETEVNQLIRDIKKLKNEN